MFIVAIGHFSSSSVGATCATCRSYGAWGLCATWFYKHSAPTALGNAVFASRIKDACAPRIHSMPLPLQGSGIFLPGHLSALRWAVI
jgi:hypothetical protein